MAAVGGITTITKRDGSKAAFDADKISSAIYKALATASKPDGSLAADLASRVADKLAARLPSSSSASRAARLSVEDIQDMVESVLIESGRGEIAKAYILYRHERGKVRDEKLKILNARALDSVAKRFGTNSLKVLASRYLFRDSDNEIAEGPAAMFERVAVLVCLGDLLYDRELFDAAGLTPRDTAEAEAYLAKLDAFDNKFKIGPHHINKYHFRALVSHYTNLAAQGHMRLGFKELLTALAEKRFDRYADRVMEYYNLMASRDFLPNSPTMMNAGGRLGQLSACFVLGMPDDMEGIMKSTSDAAMIFKSGGGVGINYSDLRPEGDVVASTSGVASGPVSFMNIINSVTEVVKQGGKRRGANMGIIEAWHPDVEKFVTNKTEAGVLENFNVSVGVWGDFWESLVNSDDGKYALRRSAGGPTVREISARRLVDLIAVSAWKSAEPGLIFFDQINKYNVFAKAMGAPLRATNPCGEQSLYPYESCNLGSINLANLVKRAADGEYEFDWQRYEETIRKAARFLDVIIDVNKYPVPEIRAASHASRRIGLGVMGVADLLYKLRVRYDSPEGYDLQSKLAEALTYYSMEESVALAKSRGRFPLCQGTEYSEGKLPVAGYYEVPKSEHAYDWDALVEKIKRHGIRNVLTTTVAPTGTLSMIADCTNGMEPTFALVFEKRVTVGRFRYANKSLERALKDEGLYSDDMLARIADNYGSLRGLDGIPEWMRHTFVTAMDIHWSDHLIAQSVWQRWIGNAIAKTINMPYDASADDVKAAYLLAHELGLKGITVYRDGSRRTQVLHMAGAGSEKNFTVSPTACAMSRIRDSVASGYVRSAVDAALGAGAAAAPDEPAEVPGTAARDDAVKACPSCKSALVFAGGCRTCIECGFSGCASG